MEREKKAQRYCDILRQRAVEMIHRSYIEDCRQNVAPWIECVFEDKLYDLQLLTISDYPYSNASKKMMSLVSGELLPVNGS